MRRMPRVKKFVHVVAGEGTTVWWREGGGKLCKLHDSPTTGARNEKMNSRHALRDSGEWNQRTERHGSCKYETAVDRSNTDGRYWRKKHIWLWMKSARFIRKVTLPVCRLCDRAISRIPHFRLLTNLQSCNESIVWFLVPSVCSWVIWRVFSVRAVFGELAA